MLLFELPALLYLLYTPQAPPGRAHTLFWELGNFLLLMLAYEFGAKPHDCWILTTPSFLSSERISEFLPPIMHRGGFCWVLLTDDTMYTYYIDLCGCQKRSSSLFLHLTRATKFLA